MHLRHEPGNTYKMEGEEITRSSEEKDLGINIDDKLKFQSHISIQVKKANLWNAKLTETQIFRELSIEIESSLFN